jgi:adenosylcobyric acid synthase
MRGQGSQVIFRGKAQGLFSTRQYFKLWPKAASTARRSYESLASQYQALVIEGAGSPAEVNLAKRDLANIETARFSAAPWILVADIERGGSFASVLGTLGLVPKWMRKRFQGVVFNKFRGDASLLKPGLRWLRSKHGVRTLGVLPWLDGLALDEEDSLGLPAQGHASSSGRGQKGLKVEVLCFNSTANFSDLAPLHADPALTLNWRKPGSKASLQPDLVVLPGSKRTLEDMALLHKSGEARRLKNLAAKGTWFLGICGGLQMLGRSLSDATGVDGRKGAQVEGLGLLDAQTWMDPRKITSQTKALAQGPFGKLKLSGYEIHHGRTSLGSQTRDFVGSPLPERPLLAGRTGGRVWGSYLHGIFDEGGFKAALLRRVARSRGKRYAAPKASASDPEAQLQRWAAHVKKHLRLDWIQGFPK